MSTSTTTLAESVQSRLESISMRLDAATDNLLQTRDLLIRNLEHQMLQLQEVRSALHEAALETCQWAEQTAAPSPSPVAAVAPPLQPAIKPMGELTLESLFAPLNAVPRSAPPMAAPEPVVEAAPFVNAEVIFESEPAGQWEPASPEKARPAEAAGATVIEVKPAAYASGSSLSNEIDPALEKATLDELNEALTRAFAQIANRNASQ